MRQSAGAVGDLLSYPEALRSCRICPRRCGARRLDGQVGACGADGKVRIARAALHYWEEPPLSGERGSGAVFFSHCPLKCVFCQNADISTGGFGMEVSVGRLARIMLELEAQGAHNVNLVTATHYAPQARVAVEQARAAGLAIPVVYNTSGFELAGAIDALAGTVDVWLPDCKYASDALAGELSGAPGYLGVALEAIEHMVGQVRAGGGREVDEEGIMRRGVIVRHLVLPGHADDSMRVLAALWERFGNDVDVSVMNQYTPLHEPAWYRGHPELGRALDDEEYEAVLDFADMLGFENMWWQQGPTVSESFIPAFDATGVAGEEL